MRRNNATNWTPPAGALVLAIACVVSLICCSRPLPLQPPDMTLIAQEIVHTNEWAEDCPTLIERMRTHTPRYITIHHSGVYDSGHTPTPEKLRELYRFSVTERNWGDVPYHFIIDRQGKIYHGRAIAYAPDTNTSYNPIGHIGICVNGILTTQPFLECQYQALVRLCAYLNMKYNLPLDRIHGHMDWSPGETDCPAVIEHYIRKGILQRDIEKFLRGKPITVTPLQFDPKELNIPSEVIDW